MAGFKLWDPKKNDDYTFIDNAAYEQFERSGFGALVHRYLGVHDQGETGDVTQPSAAKSKLKGVKQIQDLFFLENRDRHYDTTVYEVMCVYNMQDSEFQMSQFNIFQEADIMFVEFHLNDSIRKLGRKMMSGDVLEFPHLRDDALLDEDAPAINKYYVVTEVSRAASGYSPLWRPHVLRAKIKPMTNSQEFNDILDREADDDSGFSVRDLISDFRDQIHISETIVAQAEAEVPYRNFETAHFYVVPGDEAGTQIPWIFAGDGKPPNGAALAATGTSFPDEPEEGDWFLHTGQEPNVLYQREGTNWYRREVDLRKKWNAAHRILLSHLNNQNITTVQGESMPERQALSKVLKPRADF
jgi:hypothetical protein